VVVFKIAGCVSLLPYCSCWYWVACHLLDGCIRLNNLCLLSRPVPVGVRSVRLNRAPKFQINSPLGLLKLAHIISWLLVGLQELDLYFLSAGAMQNVSSSRLA
jgi:hypothetical protein